MYFLGIDLGSSSIKLSVLDADQNKEIILIAVPEVEMEIIASKSGWAEQHPEKWWDYIRKGLNKIKTDHGIDLKKIMGIGIAYQMHGLVLTDEDLIPVRSAIIWCDSRAVNIGNEACKAIGERNCKEQILGSPGNFTAAKLKWVQENEPEIYRRAKYMMLPGDYIAAKFSGIAQTTASGLSEAALWNFPKGRLAVEILDQMGLRKEIIPELVPNFGHQATINKRVAEELGFNPSVKITYRAGDQPNNALSLNVLEPGDIATTAGTSAVIYAVTDKDVFDDKSRINTFLHVNNTVEEKRNGVMVCINGSGILYQWLRNTISLGRTEKISYKLLNEEASKAEPGSKNLRFYPFGNGVERIFNNQMANSGIENLNFNIHKPAHLIRSAFEGIVFAMKNGFDIMKSNNISGNVVKAGKSNLFISPVFREIFCNTTQTNLQLYKTSGAEGAARGAAYGYGFFGSLKETFDKLEILERVDPNPSLSSKYQDIYQEWQSNIKIQKN